MSSVAEVSIAGGMPASVDTERTLLGSILQDDVLLDEANTLEPEAFSLDSHRLIFRRMRKMAAVGQKIDLVTLASSLRESKELSSIGGVAYLASLTEGMPRFRHVHGYVEILKKKWMLRRIVTTCSGLLSRAADQGDENPVDLVMAADQELLAIAAEDHGEWPSLEKQTYAEITRIEAQRSGLELQSFDYGIASLDHLVGGLVPREVTVLGGRPGQGKSALIAQIAVRHCRRGVPVHVFSIEMTAGQFLRRVWSIVAKVAYHKLRHPERQSPEEARMVYSAALEVSNWPLVIDDVSTITSDQLVARARISKRRQGTKIVAVDYLQKMRFSSKPQYRYMEVTDAMVQLARLAKEEDLALLLLSSVSEKTGKGRNDPPTLQDFRQSGDISYEASCALLLHREIDEETETFKPDGVIIVAKARSDETGAVAVRFNSSHLLFEEPSRRNA